MQKIFRISENKTSKRLFLIFGFLNFLITNIVLQFLLILIPTLLATISSQMINLIIGYYLFGKKVFKYRNLNNAVFRKYLLLASTIWVLNYGLIQFFFNFGVNKNLTAIFILPLLVLISYFSQKYFVFR